MNLLKTVVFTPVLLMLSVQYSAAERDYKTWKDNGGGPDSSKYVELNQISKSNVSQLQTAWTYPVRDGINYAFNPIIVDNMMYVLARNYSLVALDATTGKEVWVHENLRGIAPYGINYWESKDRKDRRLIFQMNHYLQEIDARTGKSVLSFGKNGLVSLKEGLGRDPAAINRIQSNNPGRIFENLLILGSVTGEFYAAAPGDLRAFDVVTGKNVWTFHTIPHPGEFGYETWPKDAWKYSGGANTWGEIAIDEKRGIAYFPTGSPTYDFYGADRQGNNLFGNCLLALDARTGKRLWHFQLIHHDLWDWDATSAPQLVTVRHNGKMVDVVAQASKQGFLYVFDRVTGQPLWPIEERPTPGSNMPGEQASPTQPFPTAPPPFSRQRMTVNDINPFMTPEEQAHWKDRLLSGKTELFTPPSTQYELFATPSSNGGSNWGTTAANPKKGLVFISAQDTVSIYKLYPEPVAFPGIPAEGPALYAQNCQGCHGADRAGSAAAPSLLGITKRFKREDFAQVVVNGRGEMPSFPNLAGNSLNTLFGLLSTLDGPSQPRAAAPLGGPVVASGGAPDGDLVPARYGGMIGPPYPEGVAAPAARYYSGYGHDHPNFMSPPWSWLVAYDLNKGTIAWKVPHGDDAPTVAKGGKDTGLYNAGQKHGMVVTSAGLIFIAGGDSKVRAFDQDNGNVLWTATLPAVSQGIPAMYEANGRQYLVVSAAGPRPPGNLESDASPDRGYFVYALPEKSK